MLLGSGSVFGVRSLGRLAAVVVASCLLAACASTSDGGGHKLGGHLFGLGGNKSTRGVSTVGQPFGPEFFLKSGYCPPVEMQADAATLITYARGHQDDPQFLQYQDSITKTARECHPVDADTLSIKVGVAGRVVAGPKGTAGNVTVPLRVVVLGQNSGKVFFTKAYKVPVALTSDYSAEFSRVFDDVVFDVTEQDRDLIVFVGFDQGKTPGVTG
jgi:hypothetical protein